MNTMKHKPDCKWIRLTGHLPPELCQCQMSPKRKRKKATKKKLTTRYYPFISGGGPRIDKHTNPREQRYQQGCETFTDAKNALLSMVEDEISDLRRSLKKLRNQTRPNR